MVLVYKLLRSAEWAAFQADGVFAGSSDDLRDGFIHLSAADQVAGTRAKWFADTEVVLLAVDAADVRWEPSRGGALFPHLYRPLRLGEVSLVAPPWPV